MGISSAVLQSAVARVVGIKTTFKDFRNGGVLFLPQRIMVVGQGSSAATYPTTKAQFTKAFDVGQAYGVGSPLHLAAMKLFPTNGDGVGTIPVTFYPLEDDASGVAAAGDITPVVAATLAASYLVRVSEIDSEEFVIDTTDTVATVVTKITDAINAVLEMPVIATDSTTTVDVVSKWKGTSANDIVIEVVGRTDVGNSFVLTQPTGGLINPSVDAALAQVGDVWESLGLNCLDTRDTVALDDYSVFGEGRWGALTRKPLVMFSGNTDTTVATATTVPEARKTDRVNAQLVAPGSNELPFVVAARQLARIAVVADNDPARDYGSQAATQLTPGIDGVQWTYADRDSAVKKGSSTTEVKDGVINLSDTVTFYHPSGDPIPAYRFVVDIIKLQTIIFNIDLAFNVPEWDGAPLIPDDQPTTSRSAKKPKMAIAEAAAVVDSLGLNAIISDPESAKAAIEAAINDQNPKRLDMIIPIQLSGNTNIISIDLDFGFYFGEQRIVN